MGVHENLERSVDGLDGSIVWKISKNAEYEAGSLSKVFSLYVVDLSGEGSSANKSLLIRVCVSCDGSPFGDNVSIDFMFNDVFSCKFESRRKSSLLKIKEFLSYMEAETGFNFVEKMQQALISEYKKDLRSIRANFYS